MNRYYILAVLACGALAACEQSGGPSITVSELRILAPLPGSNMSVAYLTIKNHGNELTQLVSVSSPQYKNVAVHATTDVDGIARMRPVDNVAISANGEVEFTPGGLHIMLMKPIDDVEPGMQISMQLNFHDNMILVSADLQERKSPR